MRRGVLFRRCRRSEGQKIGGVDSKLKSKWPFVDRLDADVKAHQRSSVLKTPLSYSSYSIHSTHDTHDTRITPYHHSALLFFLFLNRVLLFDRDRPMQSFYRGVW